LPVYKGADLIANCLDCLQRQTFGDFEAIISVDGGDAETAAAARPFLVDPRFRMVVHPERLDWVGNFNWLLQQDLREFFCYRQHDDATAPNFFEVLLQTADRELKAAAVYCDCQYTGGRNDIEIAHSIEGETLDRLRQYIEFLPVLPARGLIRTPAIRQTGLVRSNEVRAGSEIFVWLAKLVRWGNFRRVGKALYYRLDHPDSITNQLQGWPEVRKRVLWTTMFTGLLEAAIPLCRTPEERLFFQQAVVDRIVIHRPNTETRSSKELMAQCLERLRHEGSAHLLTAEELPPIVKELERRLDEINMLERSRTRRFIHRMRRRSRIARLIYPRSQMRRAIYQARYPFKMLRRHLSKLLLPT